MKFARILTVSQVSPQGTDAVQISLVGENGQAPGLPFKPGQYVTVAAEIAGEEHLRSYSITSAPSNRNAISFLVRRVPGGKVSNWICDNVKIGGKIRILPPAGRFTLTRPGKPSLLFAGGSGIAPIFALARQALEENAPSVAVFYANRDRATLMLAEQLAELGREFQGRLNIRFWFDSEDGLPKDNDFYAIAAGFEQADVYLCGPTPFMLGARSALLDHGYRADQIHQESFAGDDKTDAPGSGSSSKLKVKLKGNIYDVEVKAGQPLLAAMLEAGLHVPYSCKVGECASCMCRLLDGTVEMTENSVLDEDDISEGWILACSSKAVTEDLVIWFS